MIFRSKRPPPPRKPSVRPEVDAREAQIEAKHHRDSGDPRTFLSLIAELYLRVEALEAEQKE